MTWVGESDETLWRVDIGLAKVLKPVAEAAGVCIAHNLKISWRASLSAMLLGHSLQVNGAKPYKFRRQSPMLHCWQVMQDTSVHQETMDGRVHRAGHSWPGKDERVEQDATPWNPRHSP